MLTIQSTTLVGASVAANSNTEISHATESWAQVGDHGLCMIPYSTTPANNVRPTWFRCPTTAGTILLSWNNPTAGALTPTSATAAAPYTFIVFRGV